MATSKKNSTKTATAKSSGNIMHISVRGDGDENTIITDVYLTKDQIQEVVQFVTSISLQSKEATYAAGVSNKPDIDDICDYLFDLKSAKPLRQEYTQLIFKNANIQVDCNVDIVWDGEFQKWIYWDSSVDIDDKFSPSEPVNKSYLQNVFKVPSGAKQVKLIEEFKEKKCKEWIISNVEKKFGTKIVLDDEELYTILSRVICEV